MYKFLMATDNEQKDSIKLNIYMKYKIINKKFGIKNCR